MWCTTFVKHGRERYTTSALHQHRRSQKCRLRLIGVFSAVYFCILFILSYSERIISRLDVDQIVSQMDNPSSHLSPSRANDSPSCSGLTFHWRMGSPYITYPFSIHDLSSRFKPGYKLVFIDDHNNIIRVQSNACTGTFKFIVSAIAGTCSTCQALGPLVETVHARAKKPPKRLDLSVLSHEQTIRKVGLIERNLKKERLAVCLNNDRDDLNVTEHIF